MKFEIVSVQKIDVVAEQIVKDYNYLFVYYGGLESGLSFKILSWIIA